MDDRRFDDLTRALVNPSSRRGALRLLAGALAALPLLRPDGAAACAPPGGKCNPNRPGKCCSGKCSPKGTCLCTKASQCPRPPACKKAVCTGTGKCTTQNKPAGAGCDDGDPCTVDDTCDGNGVCEPGTPMQCNGGKQCVNGNCECPTGQGDCEGTGICGPLGSDPNYCGSCTNKCKTDQICRNGQCVCDGTRCGDGCQCSPGKVCQNGECVCDGTSCRNGCVCENPEDRCLNGVCLPQT